MAKRKEKIFAKRPYIIMRYKEVLDALREIQELELKLRTEIINSEFEQLSGDISTVSLGRDTNLDLNLEFNSQVYISHGKVKEIYREMNSNLKHLKRIAKSLSFSDDQEYKAFVTRCKNIMLYTLIDDEPRLTFKRKRINPLTH